MIPASWISHTLKRWLVRRNRGWIPAQAAWQARDKGPVRVPVGAKAVGFSQGACRVVVQAPHDPAGNQFLHLEVVEDQFASPSRQAVAYSRRSPRISTQRLPPPARLLHPGGSSQVGFLDFHG